MVTNQTPPRRVDEGVVRVSSLTCHAHVDMAIDCLESVRRCSVEDVEFQIHDDGSLTDGDVAKLAENLNPCRIIRREEADERMAHVLAGYPAAWQLRETYPLALKLFDCALLSRSEILCFCDSDVLFMSPVTGLAEAIRGRDTNAVFMEDRENSYSFRSWHKRGSRDTRLPRRVNSGLIAFRMTEYDLNYLNWFIGRSRHRSILHVLEQTAWAALGKRVGCRKYDPRQVRVMREGEATDGLVAGHFTARTRHLLPEFIERSRQVPADAEPVTLRTIPAGECTALDLARFELRRLASRFKQMMGARR